MRLTVALAGLWEWDAEVMWRRTSIGNGITYEITYNHELRMLAVCIFLWIVSRQDLQHQTISAGLPAAFLIAAIPIGFLLPPQAGAAHLANSTLPEALLADALLPRAIFLVSGALPGAALLIISFLRRGAIGAGDGLCLIACGLWIGSEAAMEMLVLAAFMAGLYSAVCLAIRKMDKSSTIAFLPFLAAAQSICLCRDVICGILQ